MVEALEAEELRANHRTGNAMQYSRGTRMPPGGSVSAAWPHGCGDSRASRPKIECCNILHSYNICLPGIKG